MIYAWEGEVDPGIRSILVELNDAGFRTAGSCEGHRTPWKTFPAVVEFGHSSEFDADDWREIGRIIRSVTDVPFRINKRWRTARFEGPVGSGPPSPVYADAIQRGLRLPDYETPDSSYMYGKRSAERAADWYQERGIDWKETVGKDSVRRGED